MPSLCFIVPVKIDTPSQEFYIRRCVESIRMFYPTAILVLVLASGTLPLDFQDPSILQVPNPYFSTLGCLYLFHVNKYTDYAIIMHDSMVVINPIPIKWHGVSYLYDFQGCIDLDYNDRSYRKMLTTEEYVQMTNTHTQGCFGLAIGIEHGTVEKCGILRFVPLVTTKVDLCAMERIFPYLCRTHGIDVNVLCDWYEGGLWHDVWEKNEPNLSLQDILKRKYTQCIFKTVVSRK
jgi:hypothetical protein